MFLCYKRFNNLGEGETFYYSHYRFLFPDSIREFKKIKLDINGDNALDVRFGVKTNIPEDVLVEIRR